MTRSIGTFLVAATAAAGLLVTAPLPARACGGFFCNSGSPVNQAAERIVFAKNADGTITAVVQILYQGPSTKFAWVLPVPGSPEVQVSSNLAFQRLQLATNPVYQLQTRVEGTCGGGDLASSPQAGGDAGVFSADGGAGGGVSVVDQGSVGPYDYVTLSLDSSLPEPADVAVDWLTTNGYDVTDLGRERLGPYLADGLNLIAFRLAKDRSTGSIRPIYLTFEDDEPMIPIRPTAVAATPDMGVMAWVLGPSRAVPANYLSLELDEALINWFSPGSNYDDVVSAAADEAGGQGFVTELAGATDVLRDVVVTPYERSQWQSIASADWTGMEGMLLQQSSELFGAWDGYRDVIERMVPVPDGVPAEQFYGCPSCYYDVYGTPDVAGLDPVAFVAALRDEVYEPMARTQQLLTKLPYVTRLYTTMSADEMTMDPIFGFNPTLGDVSNFHTATRVIECNRWVSRFEAPWRVELASGDVVRGTGTTWPFTVGDGTLPANRRVTDLDRTGMGSLVTDNTAAISSALAQHNRTVPSGSPGAFGGGCAVDPGAPAPPLSASALLAIGALLYLRRRRR